MAYRFAPYANVMLLDCWSIPCAMALTYFFLKIRYNWRHLLGGVIAVVGLVILFLYDVIGHSEDGILFEVF